MKLRTLTTKNFMPYKGDSRIQFPTDEFRNVMLVFGDNMRGKTSLMNAIRWGFYERALGRHSQTIPLQELLNREAALENDWTFEVRIEFEADGRVYDLRRRAEKRSTIAVPQRPEDFQVQVYLLEDGIPVQGDLIASKINLVAPEQVSRFFLFDGELLQEYETLLIEGSEQGRQIKDAIEQVLGVPALINGRDELGTLLKEAQKAQQKDMQRVSGLEKLSQTQAELIARQESYERDARSLQTKLDATRAERMSLDDEIEASQKIYTAKTKLDGLKERRAQITKYQEEKRKERLRLLSVAWKDLVEIKVSVRRQQLEEQRRELQQATTNKAVNAHRVKQLEQLLHSQVCPTCRQTLEVTRREEIGKELGSLQAELEAFKDHTAAMNAISAQIDALNRIKGTNVRDQLAQIDKDIQNFEVELTRIDNETAPLEDEIRGYDTAEIARKRAQRDIKFGEESRLNADLQNVRDNLKRIKEELAVNQKTIEGLSQIRSQRSTIKMTLCSQLEKVFSHSIERLRDRLRQTVETRANEAFRKMISQKAYRGLEINQNYGLSIIDDRGQRVTVRSAGAEQIVALSLIDGLNRTGRVTGPVVMDTPFGRLDPNHRDNILSYMPSVTSQFVLLVHRGEVRPETDLASIAPKIGSVYKIREINSRHSVIEKDTI